MDSKSKKIFRFIQHLQNLLIDKTDSQDIKICFYFKIKCTFNFLLLTTNNA